MHATPATAGLLYVGKEILFPVTIQGNTIHIIKIKKDSDEKSCELKSFVSEYAVKKGMRFEEEPLHFDEKPLKDRFIVVVPAEEGKWIPVFLTNTGGVQPIPNISQAGTPEDALELAQNLADLKRLFWVPNFYGSMKSQNYIKC